jgi:hypothetical protein
MAAAHKWRTEESVAVYLGFLIIAAALVIGAIGFVLIGGKVGAFLVAFPVVFILAWSARSSHETDSRTRIRATQLLGI